MFFFFFSSRRRHTRYWRDWSSDVCSSDLETGRPGAWFASKEDPRHIREGIANLPLPLGRDGSNLVLFPSGWGDGVYPVIGGYDAEGGLVAVTIHFSVITITE